MKSRTVTVTITRTQTTTLRIPGKQPLTSEALTDGQWERIWDQQDYDTETDSVVIEETQDSSEGTSNAS